MSDPVLLPVPPVLPTDSEIAEVVEETEQLIDTPLPTSHPVVRGLRGSLYGVAAHVGAEGAGVVFDHFLRHPMDAEERLFMREMMLFTSDDHGPEYHYMVTRNLEMEHEAAAITHAALALAAQGLLVEPLDGVSVVSTEVEEDEATWVEVFEVEGFVDEESASVGGEAPNVAHPPGTYCC